MQISDLRIGQEVVHPEHDGIGLVEGLTKTSAEIFFNSGRKTLGPEECKALKPSGAMVDISTLTVPLKNLLQEVAELAAAGVASGITREEVARIGTRWLGGKLSIKPRNPELAAKELDLDTFLHKIVMVRDQLRVLEQKINSHPKLDDAERVELHYYITRAYGSLTTFNTLFRDTEDHF